MRTTNHLAAEKILAAHQRKDIGSCLCGWGVDDGHLGHSHAGHIIDVLTAAKLISEPAAVDREALAAKIKDAYYHARDNGGTMHTAADDAADLIIGSGILLDADAVRHRAWNEGCSRAMRHMSDEPSLSLTNPYPAPQAEG